MVMKKIRSLITLPFFLLPCLAGAQLPDSLSACLDSAITHAQRYSLYRNRVNWDAVREGMFWRAGLAANPMDLRESFWYMLEELNDIHARFFYQNQIIAWYHGEPSPHQATIDPKVWTAIQSGKQKFQFALLPNQTGYLRVVGMPVGDNVQLAAPIRAALCTLLDQGARRWIIDLRYNGGGNMFPMLAGLAPLIGEGDVGGSLDGSANRFSTWTLHEGDVHYNGIRNVDMENPCLADSTVKVAVLTSRYTVSSGEVVAVALKGRPNTRFFGEPTAGFTSETDLTLLPTGVTMSIGVGYFMDRQGRVYTEPVPVDEAAGFVPDAEPEKDTALNKAMDWLGR